MAGNWKTFNVAGVTYPIPKIKMRRLDWIHKYCVHGSAFEAVREPDNEFDENAIAIYHVLKKSGKRVHIGYVPNSEKKQLADEWAPLMDDYGWIPKIVFGQKFIEVVDGPDGEPISECRGFQLRYATR